MVALTDRKGDHGLVGVGLEPEVLDQTPYGVAGLEGHPGHLDGPSGARGLLLHGGLQFTLRVLACMLLPLTPRRRRRRRPQGHPPEEEANQVSDGDWSSPL